MALPTVRLPPPRPERLYSNLLCVDHIAPIVFVADTQINDPREVWDKIKLMGGKHGPEWILKDRKLWSFWDLHEFPWNEIVDVGTVEEIGTFEWANSDPPNTSRDLVQVLNSTLRATLYNRLQYDKQEEYFYYPLPPEAKGHVTRNYSRGGRQSALTVVETYKSFKDPTRISYCRHMAFRARFQIYESKWYLEINPTYHFTWNGRRDRFYEERLRRIKQIERQPRVFAELCMWADLLVEPPSLLQPNHDFLRFGQLLELDSPVSIDDMAWLPQENQQEIMALREHTDQMPLF